MHFLFHFDANYLLSFGKWYFLLEKRVGNEDKWKTIVNFNTDL